MITPVISIVIPTYNRSWGLQRAVASVLSQTFSDFELIITDDASMDDTPDVVRSFNDPRIRYKRQSSNVGVARNWGTGVEEARGEFLALLMDDDRYDPEFLARRVTALRGTSNAVLAFSGYRLVPEDEGQPAGIMNPGYDGPCSLDGSDLFHAALSRKIFVGTALYRVSAVRKVWSTAESMNEIVDYALNIELARLVGATGLYLAGFDFVMSAHAGQISNSKKDLCFSLPVQLYRKTLADNSLTPSERQLVRDELCYWYLQWSKHEGWVVGRFVRALTLICCAIRLKPLIRPCWSLALRMLWAGTVNLIQRSRRLYFHSD